MNKVSQGTHKGTLHDIHYDLTVPHTPATEVNQVINGTDFQSVLNF